MEIEEMLHELHKAVKTSDDEIMCLPFGNSSPNEVIDWLINLSNEDFEMLMKTPIIVQAKVYYRKIRNEKKGEEDVKE